jgi:hypothetical protein
MPEQIYEQLFAPFRALGLDMQLTMLSFDLYDFNLDKAPYKLIRK